MACSLGHMTSILISPHTSEVHFGLIAEVPALILDMSVQLETVVLCGVAYLSYLVICCCKSRTPDCYLQRSCGVVVRHCSRYTGARRLGEVSVKGVSCKLPVVIVEEYYCCHYA